MKTRIKSLLACGVAMAGMVSLWAQKPKSQKEVEALQAFQAAKTPDDQIKAIENVLTNFADTEYKVILLQIALQVETQKGDYAQMIFYGERLLEADPKNTFAYVTLAGETARRTRENDLDKEEQLAKADKWAKAGIETAKDMPKSRPDVTDQQWDGVKKDLQSQGYVALAMSAALRKKYDDAIANYKQAISVAATPDSTVWVRLGQVYSDAGKLDEASSAFDKALSDPNAPASVKQIAQSKKDEIAKKKAPAGAKPPGTP
ncbi:MAG TPA: tetratricopeptide repeat protein [Bryobacteraceae bacterium]|nr:tetratricopeptide repeat protein [Bryobacteraceae bacterium]